MLKKLFSNSKRGFTLPEILVVIAIIGVLTTIAIASGSQAKKNARDNQRKTDIQLLQLKLEAYREQYGVYPKTLDDTEDTGLLKSGSGASGFAIPTDPTTKLSYTYIPMGFSVGACGPSYYLYATLENDNNVTLVDRSKPPISVLVSCVSGVYLPTISPLPTKIYDVTSPK